MRIAILDDWADTVHSLDCFDKLGGHDVEIWTDRATDKESLIRRIRTAEALVLIRERTALGREIIMALPALRLISLWGPWSHIDLNACRHAGVLVSSVATGTKPSFATAELSWALVMAAARRLPGQMASLQDGRWQTALGQTLRGRQLGVLGLGNIGQVVASYGVTFGMSVSVWGSDEGRARARMAGYSVPETREAFFCGCDVLSLHLRLAAETAGSVTGRDLATMKPGSILVNTSRAQVLEHGALLAALDNGRPGTAAIDVFNHEPADPSTEPLLRHPNVIATPHLGYATRDEFEERFAIVFEQILAFGRGQPINIVS